MSLVRVKRVIVGTANDVNLNHILAFAAALSYYFVMAFFPALIALAAIVAYLPVPDLFNTIVSTMARVVPPESMGLIRRIVADVISPSRGALLVLRIDRDALDLFQRFRRDDRSAERGLRRSGDPAVLEDAPAGDPN